MRRSMKGSYTVEMAMLFPLIMVSIIVVIYMAFFIHDRTVMSVAAYQSAMRAARITDETVDVASEAEKACKDILKKRFISTKNLNVKVSANVSKVKVSCKADFVIPNGVIWIKELRSRGFRLSAERQATRLNPTEHVRVIRKVRSRT